MPQNLENKAMWASFFMHTLRAEPPKYFYFFKYYFISLA